MSIYNFITKPFRYADSYDNVVRTNYALARQIQLDGRMTNLSDAATVAADLLTLLKAPRIRFEVAVLGTAVVTLDMYDGGVPCATLLSDRFGLAGGRLVAIPEYALNLDAGQTILRCWG